MRIYGSTHIWNSASIYAHILKLTFLYVYLQKSPSVNAHIQKWSPFVYVHIWKRAYTEVSFHICTYMKVHVHKIWLPYMCIYGGTFVYAHLRKLSSVNTHIQKLSHMNFHICTFMKVGLCLYMLLYMRIYGTRPLLYMCIYR